jgi:ubiquinone/menaquinone biosynthesis C-methylase UbiE
LFCRPLPALLTLTARNSNRSIVQAQVEYVWENGRRYCGAYHMPNDKQEQMRQLLYHEIYKSAFDNEISTVPLDNPTRILDVGAGTGEWAIDAADCYPECEVTGIDIADIFPRYNTPNLFWEVDDAELEWLRAPDSYDLVHLRDMAGAFQDWSYIYQQAFKVCKPGGWIEVLDKDELQRSGNFMEFFEPDSVIHKIFHDWTEAGELSGRPIGIGHIKTELLRQAGFVDVTLTERVIPISPSQMETGHLFLKALIDAIESSALRLLTKHKGYTAEEVRVAAGHISKELKRLALKQEMADSFVVQYLILSGRKPGGELGGESGLESQPTDTDASNIDTPATTSGPIDFDAMLQKHLQKFNAQHSSTATETGDTQLADNEETGGPVEPGDSQDKGYEAESREFFSSFSGRPKSMHATPVKLLIPRRTST